jgi:FKBP-type peptidyl-prolyl cis-trans isomerase FkpA
MTKVFTAETRRCGVFFVCCFLLAISCKEKLKTYSGYSKENGFYYKLISIGDGKTKPDSTQTLWIDVSCQTLKDSVFWDSKHNLSQKLFVNINSYSFINKLYTFSVGDSLQYLIPSPLFFTEFFDTKKVAVFCEKDSAVKMSVKILQVLTDDELAHIKDSLFVSNEQKNMEEFSQIKNYVTANFKKAITLANDAFMEVSLISKSDSVKQGKRIKMAYKGSYLDGRLVDFTPENKPFEFIMGQQDQIIEGLRLALCHLKRGEKAKIILPSRLAFGSGGGSNGNIAPYSPLLYEVEILDVK